ncbi:MAG: peptide-methionine (S)-S-oxide reductase, partial [Acidobacteriota bacterium]|nr:peptide-methionine (S)-S-oxide reductase [Acidobacteriota bacterium]
MVFWKSSSPLRLAALLGIVAAGAVLLRTPLFGAEAPVIIAPPAVDNPKSTGPVQVAVLSGGCFWG